MNKLVIGIDEAGYGPSMGPLVIGATVWRIPQAMTVETMHRVLEPEILSQPWSLHQSHVPIGDSKQILNGKLGWASLCCGARFLVESTLGVSSPWWQHTQRLISSDWNRLIQVDWYRSLQDCGLELSDAELSRSDEAIAKAHEKLRSSPVQLLSAKLRVLDEPEFNRQVKNRENKAAVLSETSLTLAKEMAMAFAQTNEPVEIYCDKHGGRNRYQAVLMYCFDNHWFESEIESKHLSRYRTTYQGHCCSIQFRVGGDSLLPSAAASILGKWVREWCMISLNLFWQSHASQTMKSTAGYYVDAMRYAELIEPIALRLGIDRSLWWRVK